MKSFKFKKIIIAFTFVFLALTTAFSGGNLFFGEKKAFADVTIAGESDTAEVSWKTISTEFNGTDYTHAIEVEFSGIEEDQKLVAKISDRFTEEVLADNLQVTDVMANTSNAQLNTSTELYFGKTFFNFNYKNTSSYYDIQFFVTEDGENYYSVSSNLFSSEQALVYVGGENADDSNDGQTKQTSVSSIFKAFVLADNPPKLTSL